jgi:hypothetical protein
MAWLPRALPTQEKPGSNACAASGTITVAVLYCCTRPHTGAHDFELYI